MERNVLKSFETFEEFPDKYLCVDSKSNYYYIKKDDESFITYRNIELISSNNNETTIILDYYNILDGSLVSRTKTLDKQNEIIKDNDKLEIISLAKILNVKENNPYFLSLKDIKTLTNFKEENSKTYGIKPRKNYF